MYKVTILWYGTTAVIDQTSDFYEELNSLFPIDNRSKVEVDKIIHSRISNISYNHYNKFNEQLEIEHQICY